MGSGRHLRREPKHGSRPGSATARSALSIQGPAQRMRLTALPKRPGSRGRRGRAAGGAGRPQSVTGGACSQSSWRQGRERRRAVRSARLCPATAAQSPKQRDGCETRRLRSSGCGKESGLRTGVVGASAEGLGHLWREVAAPEGSWLRKAWSRCESVRCGARSLTAAEAET